MTVLRTNIVIRNGTEMRLVRNLRNGLAPNEVAVEVIINTPPSQRVVGSVTVDLPTPAPVTVEAGAIAYPESYADEETYREEGE